MKKIITICFLLIMAKNSFGQITFQKTYGGTGGDVGYSVDQTMDGGYIIAGVAIDDFYLIKTDANGDTIWTKLFGGTGIDQCYSVQQTMDSGYIVVGLTESFGSGFTEIYLIKTNINGDILWTKTFGGISADVGNSIQQTTDGGYIIAGFTFNYGAGGEDVILIKTNDNGNIMWTKTYGGTSDDYGTSVQQTSDGGYIILGYTYSFGAIETDIYLIRTNNNGDTLWTKTFGGTSEDRGYSIQQTIDGDFVITGQVVFGAGAGPSDVYLIKVDSIGIPLWIKAFGVLNNVDSGNSIKQTSDDGYIIAGFASYAIGHGDVYLIKTDSNGDSIWTKTFGGTGDNRAFSVQQTTDGGYIITGYKNNFGASNYDVYLIKTDSLGNGGCNEVSRTTIVTTASIQVTSPPTIVTSPSAIEMTSTAVVGSGGDITTLCTTVGINETPNQEELVLFPNPFSDKINITTERNEPVEITLFDVTSRKLLQQQFKNTVTLNTAQLAKGIYIYEVTNNKGVIGKGKVVKE